MIPLKIEKWCYFGIGKEGMIAYDFCEIENLSWNWRSEIFKIIEI